MPPFHSSVARDASTISFEKVYHKSSAMDQNVWDQSFPSNIESRTSVTSEINVSSGDSFEYIDPSTKDNLMKETPRDFNWNLNLDRLNIHLSL